MGLAAYSPPHTRGRRRLRTESSPPRHPTPSPLLLGLDLYSKHFSLYILCRGLAGRCCGSWTGQDVVAIVFSFFPFVHWDRLALLHVRVAFVLVLFTLNQGEHVQTRQASWQLRRQPTARRPNGRSGQATCG